MAEIVGLYAYILFSLLYLYTLLDAMDGSPPRGGRAGFQTNVQLRGIA